MAIQLGSRLAQVNNNPGNLKFVGQQGASLGEGGFARFETPESGYGALKSQIQLDASRGHTLGSFINKYAPSSENDTGTYIQQMSSAMGANPDAPLSSLDVDKLARAMAQKESSSTFDGEQVKAYEGSASPLPMLDDKGNPINSGKFEVKFDNGKSVMFDKQPSQQAIDEVSKKVNGGNTDTQNNSVQPNSDINNVPTGNGYVNPNQDTSKLTPLPVTEAPPQKPLPTTKDLGNASLIDKLKGRYNDVKSELINAGNGPAKGSTGRDLQSSANLVGSVAGAVNDIGSSVVDNVLDHMTKIPGTNTSIYKVVGNVLGKAAEGWLSTGVGKSIANSLMNFGNQHPQLAKNIGNGFNVITAIPVLEGFANLGKVTLDTTDNILKNKYIDITTNGLSEQATSKASKKSLDKITRNGVNGLIENNTLPKYVVDNGKLIVDSKPGMTNARNQIEELSNQLDDKLKTLNTTNVSDRLPVSSIQNDAASIAKRQTTNPSVTDGIFKTIEDKYGTPYLTLDQIREEKGIFGNKIKFNSPSFEPENLNANGIVHRALQTSLLDAANKAGLEGVDALNKSMTSLYNSIDFLDKIDRKVVNHSVISHNLIKAISSGVGATAGGMLGGLGGTIPGAFLGGGASDLVESGFNALRPKSIASIGLSRISQQGIKNVASKTTGKIGGLLGSALAQKAARQ